MRQYAYLKDYYRALHDGQQTVGLPCQCQATAVSPCHQHGKIFSDRRDVAWHRGPCAGYGRIRPSRFGGVKSRRRISTADQMHLQSGAVKTGTVTAVKQVLQSAVSPYNPAVFTCPTSRQHTGKSLTLFTGRFLTVGFFLVCMLAVLLSMPTLEAFKRSSVKFSSQDSSVHFIFKVRKSKK